MVYEKKQISCEGSTGSTVLSLYLLDASGEMNIKKRPIIVICPGGGYEFTSDREAEPIAMQLLGMGYHAAVLRYSVAPAEYPTAILELGKSIHMIRENAIEWNVDADKILVSGFSAGGHLACSYGCFWNKPFVAEKLGVSSEVLRPNGMILGYPVITSGEYAHHDSILHLLGAQYEEKKEEMALETQITGEFPKTFVWHTYEDGLVPAMNSILLVDALYKQQIPTEFHMFAKGGHGLSLASKLTEIGDYGTEKSCEAWMSLLKQWLEDNFSL